MPRVVRIKRHQVDGGEQEQKEEVLLFHRHKVSIGDDKKLSELDSGDNGALS